MTHYRIHPRLPILLITGYMDNFAPEDIAGAAICKIAKKPLTHRELAVAVQEALTVSATPPPKG